MERTTWKHRVLECVRIYHQEGLIVNNEISKSAAKKYHEKNLTRQCGINFMYAMATLRKCNIIYRPKDSGNHHNLVFKPGKLDLILEGQDAYVAKSENKVIVSQNVAFRPKENTSAMTCTACNRIFGSQAALQQHKKDKVHVVSKLKKEVRKLASAEQKINVHAEIVPGACNNPELILHNNANFTKTLVIRNKTQGAITLDNIEGMNVALREYMDIAFESGVSIAPQGSYDVGLDLHFDGRRSYNMPLIITFAIASDAGQAMVEGIHKKLIFEIVSHDLSDLQPTSPYRRPNAIASDMDEAIIPGERPEFQTNFKQVNMLRPYFLTPEHISIFNAGLNLESDDPRMRKLLREVQCLLKVEKPMECLTPRNYQEMLDLLLFLEEHQIKIDIRHYDKKTDKLVHIRDNKYELDVPDLAENRPSLVVGDSVFVKEIGAEMKYEGIVHKAHEAKVTLGFHSKFSNIFIAGKTFEVSFGYNRTTLKLEHQAVNLAKQCAAYFFPTAILASQRQDVGLNCFNRDIGRNPQQLQAVREIVKGAAGKVPYLIFGPPGTGKTMTMVEAVLQVCKAYPDARVLISAPSNSAANLICERLLRFKSFSERELFRYVSYSCSLNDIPDEVRIYCNIKNDEVCQPTLESLMLYKLVVTTLTTAGRLYNAGVPRKHFAYVFIDEAGHATESETLIPITAALVDGASVDGRVILAGDPEQLGPIIHSTKAKEYGFGVSMLERLMTRSSIYSRNDGAYDNRVLTKLLNNYRSHPAIIALSNEEFYHGELKCVGDELVNAALGHEVLPNDKYPLIFHGVLGHDQREGDSPSFFNIQEIDVVHQYLKRLIGTRMSGMKIKADDIAVITPYRKQVQKLRKMIRKDEELADLEVGSIEKLQGQERLIVIISTVRSKPEYVQHDVRFHLGFLNNKKRLNVALTRARALLIVVGNPNLLKHDKYWRNYLQRCKDNKACVGAPFSLEEEDENENILAGADNIRIEVSDEIQFGRGNH